MADLAAAAIAALTPYLRAIGNGAVRTAGSVAARALYGLIEEAFDAVGEKSTWDEYAGDPQDPITVEQILAALLRGNRVLARDIEKAVRNVTDNSNWQISANQSHARVGGNGSIVGGNQTNNRNSGNTRHSYGGVVAVVAVVIVAIAAIWGGKAVYDAVKSSGLGAGSSCSEFLQADQQDELAAIRKIGVDEHVAGVGSPLALPAISYDCSGEPSARLGDVVAKFRGQF
jgi:hypothetical protein